VGRVVPVARRARDRATARTAARALALPGEPASVADLTIVETLAALGLPAAEPSRDQWPLFQDVGEGLHAAGCDGLLYHSAARPGGLCLCVFRANATAASGRLEPLARARRVSRPPVPPRGLRT